MAGKLTAKQTAFVREYLVDLNASAAARRAGYSPRTADRMGHENLKKPEIAASVQAAMDERAKRLEVTADRVVQELAKVGFANLLDYFQLTSEGEPFIDLSDITPEQAAALAELQVEDFVEGRGDDARQVRRVKIKVADKLRALDQLAQHLGIAKRVDVTSNGGALLPTAINVYLPANGRDPSQLEEGESGE